MEKKVGQSSEIMQFIVVNLGQEQYGINIKFVHNIVKMHTITRVPKAPNYINGVINLRGEIIPVMSLRVRFNLEKDTFTNNSRMIIVKINGHSIGLIVDEVKEVVNLTEEQIEVITKDSQDEKALFTSGVGKVNGELITLLNLEGFITVSGNKE